MLSRHATVSCVGGVKGNVQSIVFGHRPFPSEIHRGDGKGLSAHRGSKTALLRAYLVPRLTGFEACCAVSSVSTAWGTLERHVESRRISACPEFYGQ